MLKRKAYRQLETWYISRNVGPHAVHVEGARQVGKTYIIREFARDHYKNVCELNFFEDGRLAQAAATATSSDELFLRLSAYAPQPLTPHETLIFLDEIQECPNVLTMLKFLVQNKDFDYILSGSMLGVELSCAKSLPIGYLSAIDMYPLDFEEFCWAEKLAPEAFAEIQAAWTEKRPVDEFLHKRVLDIFHKYLLVGGMPQVVEAYIRTNDLQRVFSAQSSILKWYREDIAKYSRTRALVLKRIFDLLPAQLAQPTKRFQAKSIEGKASIERYQDDFVWLADAHVVLPCYNVTQPTAPLIASSMPSRFKLYLCDVGLLCCMLGKDAMREVVSGNGSVNYGALYENVCAQEFIAHDLPLFYYAKHGVGELDFVLPGRGESVIPVEIKSGKDYRRHLALNNVLATKNYHIDEAYVFYEGNLKHKDKVIYAPIYMLDFLHAE